MGGTVHPGRDAESDRQVLREVRDATWRQARRLGEGLPRQVHGPLPRRYGAGLADVGGASQAAGDGGAAGAGRAGLPIELWHSSVCRVMLEIKGAEMRVRCKK